MTQYNKYYLYRHIRVDNGNPFYIGIAGKTNRNHRRFETEYKRAHETRGRSTIWHNIVSKTDWYPEILFECDSLKEIETKEREFVKLYGRINLGTGILSNLTDGGDGMRNYVASEVTKKKISENSGFRGKFGGLHHGATTIYQYSLNGDFISKHIGVINTCRELNIKQGSLTSCLIGKSKSCAGFQWFYEYKGDKVCPPKRKINSYRGVEMINPNNGYVVKTFSSTVEAARFVGRNSSNISEVCKGNKGSSAGYNWRYI